MTRSLYSQTEIKKMRRIGYSAFNTVAMVAEAWPRIGTAKRVYMILILRKYGLAKFDWSTIKAIWVREEAT